MLYVFHSKHRFTTLTPSEEIEIREVDSPLLMSALCNISLAEAMYRFAEDNKAFVAFFNETPAAFGWMARGNAKIGELDHKFRLPLHHNYLWNFRTFEKFRGRGIYPRLLQYIISRELRTSESFWIMHAPENSASAKGIEKAGFRFVGEVSVLGETEVVIHPGESSEDRTVLEEDFGFKFSEHEPATCWNCSSPFVRHKKETCCCSEQGKKCNSRIIKNVRTN